MKYLKRFLERIEESDLDEVLDILQYAGELEPRVWQNDFVRFSDGLLVIYFKDATLPEIKEIEDCQRRLESIGYRLISYDVDSVGLWFLVMTEELESKYKDKLLFKFIEDLKFKKRIFNAASLAQGGFNYCNKEYPSGDTISVIQNPQKTWFVTDSITDQEEPSDNKVLANIDFLKAQHRVLGIQQSLSRGF
jgi:hypothetical protein